MLTAKNVLSKGVLFDVLQTIVPIEHVLYVGFPKLKCLPERVLRIPVLVENILIEYCFHHEWIRSYERKKFELMLAQRTIFLFLDAINTENLCKRLRSVFNCAEIDSRVHRRAFQRFLTI